MYTITELFLDESNKYRVRVIVDSSTKETIFCKFDHYPTQEEVNSVIDSYKQNSTAQTQEQTNATE